MATKTKKEIKINVSKEEYARAKEGILRQVYIPGTDERNSELNAYNRVDNPNCVIAVQCGGGKVQITPKKISGKVKISGQRIDGILYRNYYVVELGNLITE